MILQPTASAKAEIDSRLVSDLHGQGETVRDIGTAGCTPLNRWPLGQGIPHADIPGYPCGRWMNLKANTVRADRSAGLDRQLSARSGHSKSSRNCVPPRKSTSYALGRLVACPLRTPRADQGQDQSAASVDLNKRSPLKTTSRLAPMSANTAIHIVALPNMASTRRRP